MSFADDMHAQAEAIDRQAAALERANAALAQNIDLTDRFGRQVEDVGRRTAADLGGQGGRAVGSSGLRRGLAGDTASPPTSRTVQGPNGLETILYNADGSIASVVPVGPQREPSGTPFGIGGGGGGSAVAAGGPAAPSPSSPPAAGGGLSAAPGVLPPASPRSLVGTTAGGGTVVAALEVLNQYCKRQEFRVPDSSVTGASPTKGPFVRRTVWTCPVVPLILPEGGTFMEEERLPGGGGSGFAGVASPGTSATAGSFGGTAATKAETTNFAVTGTAPTTGAVGAASTAAPRPPSGPAPGERLIAESTRALAVQVGKLAEKLGASDGGLGLRTKGLTI